MSAPPSLDFALIGVPRAGNAWLAAALRQHPGAALPAVPRLGACALRKPRPLDAIYDDALDGPADALRGDVAPRLIADAEAAYRLRSFASGLKPVVLLRQPLDMLVSLYHFERRRRPMAPTFAAEIERRPELLDLGRYHRLLTPWLDVFGAERCFIRTFDEFFADERRALPEVLRHLGLDPRFRPSLLGRKVNPGDPRPPGPLRRWRNRAASLAFKSVPSAAAGRDDVRGKRFSLVRPADTLPPDLRRTVMDRLEPDLRRLEGLLGRGLDAWREQALLPPADNVVWLDLLARPNPQRRGVEA